MPIHNGTQAPIKLLIVTKSTGGLASYNLAMCQYLDQTQFDIHVVCLSDNNELYVGKLREMGVDALPMAMNRYAVVPISDVRLLWHLMDYVRHNNFDVILGHGSKAGFLVRIIERLTGVPAIYGLHSMSFEHRIQGKKACIYKQLERLATHLGGHIVTVANATRNSLLQDHITSSEHITVIHTGIDLEKFTRQLSKAEACRNLSLDPDRPVVGWAARLTAQKSPLDFVRIAHKVRNAVPDVQIYMAGEGELEAEVMALINQLSLQDTIIRAPWQSDVPAMLSAFDVYVLTSRWEGLPLSILEAMAMNVPCVATAVDGTPEVIENGVNGFLVIPGNDDQMAECIIQLLNNEDQRKAFSLAARKCIESSFTAKRMVTEWESLFRDVANHSPTYHYSAPRV